MYFMGKLFSTRFFVLQWYNEVLSYRCLKLFWRLTWSIKSLNVSLGVPTLCYIYNLGTNIHKRITFPFMQIKNCVSKQGISYKVTIDVFRKRQYTCTNLMFTVYFFAITNSNVNYKFFLGMGSLISLRPKEKLRVSTKMIMSKIVVEELLWETEKLSQLKNWQLFYIILSVSPWIY